MKLLLVPVCVFLLSRFGLAVASAEGDIEHELPEYRTDVICNSRYSDKDYHIELEPGLEFHWSHPTENSGKHFAAALHYEGKAWLGVGFSRDGSMVGSKAVIGVPHGSEFHKGVHYYDLSADEDNTPGVTLNSDESDSINLVGHIYQGEEGNGETTMHFHTPHIWELAKHAYDQHEVFNIIYAVGQDNWLGMHKKMGSFRIASQDCPAPPLAGTEGQEATKATTPAATATTTAKTGSVGTEVEIAGYTLDHKAAFAAHGFFATLTFAVLIPLALTAAWFRSVVPKWWIYIHVFFQCLAIFFVTISVSCAFAGVTMRGSGATNSSEHMTISHHWVGLATFILSVVQVFAAFRRPRATVKIDPTKHVFMNNAVDMEPKKKFCGCFNVETKRDRWHVMHVIMAVFILGMALYQMHTGFTLFSYQYGNGDPTLALSIFWTWIGILGTFLVLSKIWMARRSARLRARVPTNLMPRMREEMDTSISSIYTDSTIGCGDEDVQGGRSPGFDITSV